ncbi:MAG: hypothetical protein JWQ71_2485 [Pedosphaera sp.]|nr:hypothetical protein [Pedosphaera sp.]
MSTEPERDIEKQLKAYARQRRKDAGADMELHPATRRLLQGEVVRLSHKTSENLSRTKLLSRFWPRLAFAGSIFILLGIGTWTLLQDHSGSKAKFTMAENRPVSERKSSSQITPATPPAPPNETKAKAPASSPALGVSRFKSTSTIEEDFSKLPATKSLADKDTSRQTYSNDRLNKKNETTAASDGVVSPATAAPIVIDQLKTEKSAAIIANSGINQPAQGPVAKSYGLDGIAPASGALSLNEPTPVNGEAKIRSRVPAASLRGEESLDLDSSKTSNVRRSLDSTTQPTASPAVRFDVPLSSQPFHLGADTPSGSFTQRFARITTQPVPTRSAGKISSGTQILDVFSLERTGDQIRVIDGDGSTYYGFVNKEEAASRTDLADAKKRELNEKLTSGLAGESQKQKAGVSAEAEAIQPEHNYYFQVSGTNLTLNQPVKFSGNLIVTNALPPQGISVGGEKTKESKVQFSSGSPSLLPYSRVQGRAIIDNTNQIEINAKPVKP